MIEQGKDTLNQIIEYKFHFVAFIDILGYSDIIINSTEKSAIKEISRFSTLFEEAKSIISKQYSWEKDKFSIKFFSDCFCISILADILNADAFFQLIARIQKEFVRDRMLVRGAVTIGNHFENNSIIFSEALIEAYQIESKQAIFPRITISKKIKDFIFENGTEEDIIWFKDIYCWKDNQDNQLFIDYLNFMPYNKKSEPNHNGKDLLDHKRFIESNLDKYAGNKNIYEKFQWLANYHNSYCRFFYFDMNHLFINCDLEIREMSNYMNWRK